MISVALLNLKVPNIDADAATKDDDDNQDS